MARVVKTPITKKAVIVSIGILIVILLTACSFSSSSASYTSDDLIGTWSGWTSGGFLLTYVFKSDLSVTMTVGAYSYYGTWYLTGAGLTINWSDSSNTIFFIEFSDDYETLTMTPSAGGVSQKLKKQ